MTSIYKVILLSKNHTKVRPSYDSSCAIFMWLNVMVVFNIASANFVMTSADATLKMTIKLNKLKITQIITFLNQCLHDPHFMKTRSFSPKLSKLVGLTSAEGPCFHKLKRHCVKNEWILADFSFVLVQTSAHIFEEFVVYFSFHFSNKVTTKSSKIRVEVCL